MIFPVSSPTTLFPGCILFAGTPTECGVRRLARHFLARQIPLVSISSMLRSIMARNCINVLAFSPYAMCAVVIRPHLFMLGTMFVHSLVSAAAFVGLAATAALEPQAKAGTCGLRGSSQVSCHSCASRSCGIEVGLGTGLWRFDCYCPNGEWVDGSQ